MYCNCQPKQFYLAEIAVRDGTILGLQCRLNEVMRENKRLLMMQKQLSLKKQDYRSLQERLKTLRSSTEEQLKKKGQMQGKLLRLKEANESQKRELSANNEAMDGLRRIITLQEYQILELTEQGNHLEQQRFVVKNQLEHLKGKDTNYELKEQISTLQGTLKMKLNHSINAIFNNLEDIPKVTTGVPQQQVRRHFDLGMLHAYTKLGGAAFDVLSADGLLLDEAKEVFRFWKDLWGQNEELRSKLSVIQRQFQGKTTFLEEQLAACRPDKKELADRGVQVGSQREQQLISQNTVLKVKMKAAQEIVAFLSSLAVWLGTRIIEMRQKKPYYHLAEKTMFKALQRNKKKKRSLKPIILSIIFIAALRKMAGKRSHIQESIPQKTHFTRIVNTFLRREKGSQWQNQRVSDLMDIRSNFRTPISTAICILQEEERGPHSERDDFPMGRGLFQLERSLQCV